MTATDLKAAVQSAEKGSALQALVDGFFAGLEARTTNAIVQGLLKGANKIVDFAMSAYGLAILLSLLFLSSLANAQALPRARDVVTSDHLPRARDYVEVTVATQIEPPCKNCDCGCAEGTACSCDIKGVITSEPSRIVSQPTASTLGSDVTAAEQEPAASPVYYETRFFRSRPAQQRGRACKF